jgi:hypothetical protein
MKARFVLGGVAACLALVLVSVSFAAGGSTIANAPVVVSGQQNFGNTTAMPTQGSSSYRYEYWRLQLISGDAVTINFGVGTPTTHLEVYLYQPDVTDFNVLNSGPDKGASPQSNGKGQLLYDAQRSGTYPLMFRTCCSSGHGPFDFVAYIKHAVKLFIPGRSSIARNGSVAVQVRNPDGQPVTDKGLKVTLRGVWGKKARTLGSATPTNGLVRFKLHLPASLRGQTIKLRAIGSGPNYLGALSVFRAARVR